MGIFQKSVIQNHFASLNKEQIDKAFDKFKENYSAAKISEIKNLKEEEYQDGFLREIFVDVFDYTLKPAENYNLAREFKNQSDGKKADGAILKPLRSLGKNSIQYSKIFIENTPIPKANSSIIKEFNIKSDFILENDKLIQQKKNKFLNRVTDNFEIDKISKKIDAFYDYDFKKFLSELKKKKIKLSLVQQDEWEEYLNSYKTEINNLQNQINKTDNEIDKMVYDLYELTEEEIAIVKK